MRVNFTHTFLQNSQFDKKQWQEENSEESLEKLLKKHKKVIHYVF